MDTIDPYDPNDSTKLFKNPFTDTNPLDAILNFGSASNSNDWKKDDSISLFTKGRDRIEPTVIKPVIKPVIKQVIKPESKPEIDLESRLQSINLKISQNKSRLNNIKRTYPTKSNFGNIKSNYSYIIITFLIFIILLLIIK
jgi:hypothetical protein